MNIATLTIEMAANVARLQQDLQAARGSVDSTFASIGSSVAKLKALVGTVFAGIAVGSLLDAVAQVKTAAVDIERIAAASGASLDEFQRAAAGAKTIGVDLEKFGDIMKDTQDKLGDFLLTGGGELKDFFETIGPKVGVTAESFRNLSGPQALQLFYSSLEKANVGQKVMIQQMESIADDASMLAPLLANGGAGFAALGEEAAKAGALMSSELIYASKNLGSEMSRLDTVVGGITNNIMEGLIPVMADMTAASREELSAGFEAVSAWVNDNKEQLLGAWELTKSIGAEVWSIVEVVIEIAVGIGKWAVESGFLEASLITIGLLVAGFKDGVDIVGAAFAKLGSVILNAVAKPISGFLSDIGVVLKWVGQADVATVFFDAAKGMETAGKAGAAYADGVVSKFAAGDTAVARFTAGLGTSTQAAQTAAKSAYTAYQALGTGAGVSAKAAEEAKKSADKAAAAAQKLAEEGVKLAASLLAQDSGLSGDFAAKWDKLNAAYKAGAVPLADLTQAQKLLLAEQPAMKAAADAQTKALEEEAQAWTDVRTAMLAYGHAQEQAAQNVMDGNNSLRDEIELIGLSSKERARVMQQRSQAIILTKQATLAEMERQAAITGTMTREQIALAAEIQGLQERNELLGAQEARESWTGFWESVNSTAHDTFVDVANNGMSAFKRIGQTLKSAVLDMPYQLTIKKWIVSIGASVGGGVGGMAQAASATASTLGAAGDASSLLSAGSALSSLGAFGGAVSGFGTAALSAAQTMMGMTGTVAQMTTSLAAAGHTAASGLAAGVQAFQMIPGWGWALAGVAALASIVDFGGETRFGGGYQLNGNKEVKYTSGPGGGQIDQRLQEQVATGTYQSINAILKSLDSKLEVVDFYAGLETSGNGKGGTFAGGQLSSGIEFGKKWTAGMYSQNLSAEEAVKQFAGQMQLATVEALKAATDIPAYLQDELKKVEVKKLTTDTAGKVIEEVSKMFTVFSTVKNVFEVLDKPMFDTTTAGYKLAESFVALFGGLEGFQNATSSYYQNFYSEAEKFGNVQQQLTRTLADAGLAVPETIDAYRKLAEAQDLTTEAGRKNYAVLLENAGAFSELASYADGIGDAYNDAFGTASQKAAKDAKALADGFSSLGVEMPKTRADYQKLVAETVAAGNGSQGLALKLMALAPAFSAVEAAQKQTLESAGINSADIAATIRDSMLGRIDAADAGEKIGAMVTDGIYNAVSGGFSNQITSLMTDSVISPVIEAAMTGAAISGAVSKSAIDAMVAQAREAASALGAILSDPGFKSAVADIRSAVVSAVGGSAAKGGSSLFAIGGSAGGNYMPPEFQTFGTLASETIESNKKVSELLQKLLNPEKLFENRYRELDSRLEDKRNSNVSVAVSRNGSYATTLPELLGYIGNMQAKISNKAEIGAILGPIVESIRIAVSGSSAPDASAFKELAKMAVAAGGVKVDDAGYISTRNSTSLGWGGGRSLEDVTEEFLKDTIAAGGDITSLMEILLGTWVDPVALQQLPAQIAAAKQLEGELREWYVAQARVIAVEDMAALSGETKTATAKTEELKRTGELEDPIAKLKDSFAQKFTAIDEGINAVLQAEIAARSADENDAKALLEKYPLMRQWQMSDEEWAKAKRLFGDNIGRNMIKDEAQYMRDVIAQIEDGITAITAEQQTYIDGLNDWYKAQAELLSTEMLVDINQQIKALQAAQEGPLTAIKTAIAKYVKDLADLGTLDADAQTAIDKLSGLQLDKARKDLYSQLLTPEEIRARDGDELTKAFAGAGQAVPATTTALRDMIDAARAAGNVTLADTLLELVPAFVALQGAAGGVGDVLGNLRTATDDAYAALERAVGVQRDLLNESIRDLQAIFDLTRNAARELYGEVESASQQSAAAGRAFIDNALANAQTTGYMPDSDALREAIEGVRKGIAAQQGVSTFESERDRLVLAGKLTDLKDIAEPQLTEAQRQLAALEEMLKAERTQIDELRGINTSVLSVADAMAALAAAIAAEKAIAKPPVADSGSAPFMHNGWMTGGGSMPAPGGGGAGGSSTGSSSINDIYQQLFGRDAESAGADYWASTGLTGAALETAIRDGAMNEDKLPGFATGINFVPYDMTARIHKGEAVIPERFNPFNPGALGQPQQGSGTAELVAEMRALRAEVAALRSVGERTARSTADLLEITDQKSEGGNADRVEVMNVAELASAIAREMAPA